MDYTKVLKKFTTYYLFIKSSSKNNKVSMILKNSNKKEIFLDFKKKYLGKIKPSKYEDTSIILLKIKAQRISFNNAVYLQRNYKFLQVFR